MQTYVFEGVTTALTSISHIGETHGVNAKLRREKVVQPDGSVEEIPIISGNAIRGVLRDRGMLHLLQQLGYGLKEESGEFNGLSLAAFYFLMSGGALSKKTERGIDVVEARRWRELIPLVALFGGAMGNAIMQGKLKMGKMIPICQETLHLIPERFRFDCPSIWDMVQEEAYTRRDDEKSESLRQLLEPRVRQELQSGAVQRRALQLAGEDVVEETGQKQQMRYYVETLAAGTSFFWEIALDDVTRLEFEALCMTLMQFSRLPYIGGKSSIGHGRISVTFDQWMEIDSRVAPQGRALDVPLGNLYLKHLQAHGNEIRELINALA